MTQDGDNRTMVITRDIGVPRQAIWSAWTDPDALPKWWGPDGFSCQTHRIDLRDGGEWIFDMIGPDGTVYPNHHDAIRHEPMRRIAYTLRAGENGPKHAEAEALFDDLGEGTRVTLRMVFNSPEEFRSARDFGAAELGQQTLGKLEAHVKMT